MDRKRTDLIWTGKDYLSRDVSLYVPERDHIANEHEIMGENFTAIYDTITSPSCVYSSQSHPQCREVMFKTSKLATYYPLATKVIVDYSGEEGKGNVVTAFPTKQEGGNVGQQLHPKIEL